ncbi:MAG: hypothetical protein K940chlam6_00047 [Chlamydiae bacterium]|nr:hypothetical protein [Chlamydiota bacterium]
MGLTLTASQEILLRETKQHFIDRSYQKVIESANKALERLVDHDSILKILSIKVHAYLGQNQRDLAHITVVEISEWTNDPDKVWSHFERFFYPT